MKAAYCWRCRRKLFEVEIGPAVIVPEGIAINKNCERCGALNSVPLDRLCAYALA